MQRVLILFVVSFLFSFCESSYSGERAYAPIDNKNSIKGKNGEVVTKRLDGTIKTIVTYSNGVKHGTSYLYYPDGKTVQLEIPYVVGARHGVSKKYYQNTKLYAKTPYISDQLHGIRRTWYRTGTLKAEIPYSHGFPGIGTKEFYSSGKSKKLPSLRYLINGNSLIVSLDEPCDYARLYIGRLTDDQFLNEKNMDTFVPDDGEFIINLDVYTPSYLSLQDIICKCETSQKNPLILKIHIEV